jgi:hypothetical protein
MSDNHHKYHFFVDGKKIDTNEESVTGADIKRLASVPAEYQLFRETDDDAPDAPISDLDAVHLKTGPKKFFAVPPATFGAK